MIEAPAGTYTAPEVLPWEQAANQYKNALKPGRARLGQRRAAGITRQDIDDRDVRQAGPDRAVG